MNHSPDELRDAPDDWPTGWPAGYIDGELEPDLRRRVDAWLTTHPDALDYLQALCRTDRLAAQVDPVPQVSEADWSQRREELRTFMTLERPPQSSSFIRGWVALVGLSLAASLLLIIYWNRPLVVDDAPLEVAKRVEQPEGFDDSDGILRVVSEEEIVIISMPACAAKRLLVNFDPMGSERLELVRRDEIVFRATEADSDYFTQQMPSEPDAPVMIWQPKGP